MALFGGIGKALGLGTPGGRGFITGLAGSLSEKIDADLKATEDRVSRLGDLRLERVSRNAERYQTENRENTDIITNMAKTLGGDTDSVQFLINEYGFAGAQAKVKEYEALSAYLPQEYDASTLLGIERKSGSNATISQISKFVTRPVQDLDLSKTDPRVGFQRLFGTEEASIAELTRRSNQDIEAAGYGDMMKTSTAEDMGVVTGRRMYPWLDTLTGDYNKDYINMSAKQNDLAARHAQTEEGQGKKALFDELMLAKSLADSAAAKRKLASSVGSPLTSSDVRTTGRMFEYNIALSLGILDPDSDFDINSNYLGTSRTASQRQAMGEARDVVIKIANTASADGVVAADYITTINKAIDSNRVPVYNYETKTIIISDTPLIDTDARDESSGKLIFPEKIVDPADRALGDIVNSASASDEVKNLISQGRNATSEQELKAIKGELVGKEHNGVKLTRADVENMFPE